jgi:hypothetical protein
VNLCTPDHNESCDRENEGGRQDARLLADRSVPLRMAERKLYGCAFGFVSNSQVCMQELTQQAALAGLKRYLGFNCPCMQHYIIDVELRCGDLCNASFKGLPVLTHLYD